MKLYDAIDTPKQLYLILENVKGKILNDILKEQKNNILQEKTCAKIFGQVIKALACFHEQKIAHRDLKPENIMVDMSDSLNYPTKIIDFGFAAQTHQKMQVFCGTPAYMSPEICSKNSYDGPAGILLYTMLFG